MAQQLRNVEETVAYNKLVADISFPLQVGVVNLKAGQGVLVSGSVIAETATGDHVLYDGTDGQTPHSVLIEDVDATTATAAHVYLSGVLNRKELVVGNSVAIGTIEDALRIRGIYLKDTF